MQRSLKQINSYYFILDQILDKFSKDKAKDKIILHNALKKWFVREYDLPYDSLKDFSMYDMAKFIDGILREFSVEYGIFLKQPNDPINAEDISLAEYLEYKNWLMQDDDSLIEGIKSLPDGFILIEDINSLKTLKKNKRVVRPENLELKFGSIVYLYSYREEIYYKKILSTYTPIEKLEAYIKMKIVYAKPENH